MERNSDRFFNASTSLSRKLRYGTAKDRSDPGRSNSDTSESVDDEEKSHESRTAVIVRAHTELNFGLDTVLHLRSLIAELSLHSGGEYVVFSPGTSKGWEQAGSRRCYRISRDSQEVHPSGASQHDYPVPAAVSDVNVVPSSG